jgi:CRISPR-associated protein Csm1
MSPLPHIVALRVIQDALLLLGQWVDHRIPYPPVALEATAEDAIVAAKGHTQWPSSAHFGRLRLVFDAIRLGELSQRQPHFWPAVAIANVSTPDLQNTCPNTPYPLSASESVALDELQAEIKTQLQALSAADWGNLSILTLFLEKYGSYLSLGETDVAFFDLVRAAAAIAASLSQQPQAEELCLVAGDLSGVQSFIYTIASDGALKSLRARSFYLELVAEEVTQQLLERLELPRTSVIYTGGSKSYLLAPATPQTHDVLAQLRDEFNVELYERFQGKVFLNLVGCDFPTLDVRGPALRDAWNTIEEKLSIQKNRRFKNQIDTLLGIQPAHEPCRVCHRDDTLDLKPLDGDDGPDACPVCRQMFQLGGKLYDVGSIVRSTEKEIEGAVRFRKEPPLSIQLGEERVYFHLFKGAKPVLPPSSKTAAKSVYLINNWDLDIYRFHDQENPIPLLLGNYGQAVKNAEGYESFMSAAEMAEQAKGIKRVGHLRMDVDRLGQIFANGLGEHYTLPRLAGLSRQMSYFFKVYFNSLAARRDDNWPDAAQKLSSDARKNLLFIYAGGDDVFVTGSWNEVVEFAFDVYQSFRAYTGHHPGITLSGGISLGGPKYPLYQSAEDAGEAESAAKKNGRDSLELFGQVFKWEEWLGAVDQPVSNIGAIAPEIKKYIGQDIHLERFGVFPFVRQLKAALDNQYPRSFVQNLLATAQVQEQQIKKATAAQERDIKYFLHLPKVAYTLTRLPPKVKEAEGFEAMRASLKSPYNAPYFRAIATWIDLLNRSSPATQNNDDQ